MNSRKQELLTALHRRLLLLCSDFRHPDNHHEKSKIGQDVSVVLIEIANLEAEVRLERSHIEGGPFES